MAADLPATAPTASSADEVRPEDDPLIGRKVGAYTVVRRIGQGGMGVVYEARHDKLQQRAAIKCLHQELSQDGKILQRFFNEARAISMSRHSSIVTIYDFGQLDDGTAFILMEFLEGETLLSRMERLQLERKSLGLPMVLELGRQVATALALIHSKSIVHRDLKPENIFVVPDSVAPLGERVKLLDFGIAKFLEGPVRKTTVGMILGTPLYMSPEQCEGAEDLDAKVDVYSLGIMLFEMLVGRLPFIADTAAALMRQHMFKEPPHLLDELPDIPPELDALVTRMLAKKAAERPSMDEIVEALEALQQLATPQGAVTGARRLVSARHRPSQPETPRATDPFAATLGGAGGQSASRAATPPASGSAARFLPREPGGEAIPEFSTAGGMSGPSYPFSSGTSGPPGAASYSSLGPLSRSSAAANRTDAVVAIGRRPVNLIIAVVVLLGLGVFGWRTLAKQQQQQTQGGAATPVVPPAAKPPVPPVPPPAAGPEPAAGQPDKPASSPAPTAEPRDPDRSDTKRKPKRHKKAGEPAAKTEDGEAAAGGAPDKKARAAKVKDAGEKWEPDGQ
jgi:serine/threonine protein kinase